MTIGHRYTRAHSIQDASELLLLVRDFERTVVTGLFFIC